MLILFLIMMKKIYRRNNAGKFSHEHAMSEDGIEMTFATNYLGKQSLQNDSIIVS